MGRLSDEALYQHLGRLVASMPNLRASPVAPETNEWLGKAIALVEESGTSGDIATIKVAAQNLSGVLQGGNAQTIETIVRAALARAELRVPASAQGAFLPAGNSFDAFAAVGKIVSTVSRDVLFVDPYADQRILETYAVLAPSGTSGCLRTPLTQRLR